MTAPDGIQNDEEVAKELIKALREDTSKVSNLSSDQLYSLQMDSGRELIANSTFESMGLKESLVKGMYSFGLEKPTLIQNLAVPQIIKGKDVAFQSKSGTGKTIAFTLGALHTAEKGQGPQVLIISPTRELCIQIAKVVRELAKFLDLSVCSALSDFAGSEITEEIVVGTLGRVMYLTGKSILVPEKMKMIVLDEADDLLTNDAFSASTIKLLKGFEGSQKVFFSATYSTQAQKALAKFAPKTEKFLDKNEKADKIRLYYIEAPRDKKVKTLKDLFGYLTVAQCIIFVATKSAADFVAKVLKEDGFSVSLTHGSLTPEERDAAQNDFLHAKTKILVSTNLFARGMDIPQVNLIINYDIPNFSTTEDQQVYIHRIGRSGRFNRSGFVIDFVSTDEDLKVLGAIQSGIGSVSKKFTLSALLKAFTEEEIPSSG